MARSPLPRPSRLDWSHGTAQHNTGLVLVAELLNSALETLADHLHPEQHPEVGAAKDIAAGAVLVASAVALVVGLAFLWDWLLA